jgi:hypothetical protein
MGHTVWSQRIVAEILLNELKDFGRALRKDDRIIYEQLLKMPFKHIGSISFASSIDEWAFILLSINLEQEKKIRQLENELNGHIQGKWKANALDKGKEQESADAGKELPLHIHSS